MLTQHRAGTPETSVLMSVFPGPDTERMLSGVTGDVEDVDDIERELSGLMLVLPDEIDDRGLIMLGVAEPVPERLGLVTLWPIVLVLGGAADTRAFPFMISWYSVGDGFQDVRWKLFFFRTLALYAARIALVA